MKKKITKIWSVGLVLMLLVTLLAFAAPASAAPLEWSEIKTPGAPTKQVLASDASFITVASDGTLFAVDTASANGDVYKSNNGGTVWTVSEALTGVALVALAVSPDYVNDGTVFAASATQVYISVNGGAKFNVLGGAIATPNVTCLAVSPLYSAGNGEVMVGTAAAGVAFGDIFIWGAAGGVQNWVAQSIGDTTVPLTAASVADVTAVAFSPNYPIDATILAVGSTAAATNLYTKVTGSGWDSWGPTLINTADEVGSATGFAIVSSSIALPADYNGSIPTLRRVYVATVSGLAADDVYRVTNVTAGVALNCATATTPDEEFTSVVYSGTFNEGTLFVGDSAVNEVYRCANPTSVNTLWYASLNPPTGATDTYLALDPDFASNNKVYASTVGAESAVSVSADGAVNFYQVGLIHTTLNSIMDVAVASATEVFMATEDGAAGPESIWHSTNGGATWVRVLALNLGNAPIIRLSPDYATDQTLWVAEVGTATMRLSQNGGAGWAQRIGSGNLIDMVAADGFTLYALVGATMRQSNNGGWTWPIPPKPIAGATGGVFSIALDGGTGDIVVGGAGGTVHRLTAGAIEFAPAIGGPTGLGAVGNVTIAFDAGYANNGTLYATAAGVAGVWRFTIGRDTSWAAIGGTALTIPAIGDSVGMVAASDALYVADAVATSAAPPFTGGVQRSLNAAGPPPDIEWSNAAGGPNKLPAGATLASLAMTEGSNVLFAAENSGGAGKWKLYTYTDTLTVLAPAPLAPESGTVATSSGGAGAVKFSWDNPANATPPFKYEVQYDTRADFKTATTLAAVDHPVNYTVNAAAMLSGKTYSWRVRVSSPVTGAWSEAWTLTTQLQAAFNAPNVVVGPTERGTAPGGWDAPLSPTFSWSAYKNATGYHFQLAKDAAFTDVLADENLGTVTSYQYTKGLDNSTTYYWRVKALGADTDTDWSVVAGFTTLAKPAAAAPPVVVKEVPAPIINIPPAPPAQEFVIPQAPAPPAPIAPSYIWGIIAIGAILVIAVIVLIVRTRRAV